MCKYLPEFGWQPYILTVKNGTYPSYDESLLKDIPHEVKVYKTKTLEPFSIFNSLAGNNKKNSTVGLINLDENRSLLNKLSFYIRANFFIPDARKWWNIFAFPHAKKLIRNEEILVVLTSGPPHSTHLIGKKLKRKLGIKWIADLRDPWTSVYYNQIFPRNKRTKRLDSRMETSVIKNADLVTVVSNGLKKIFENRSNNIEIIYNGFDADDIPKKEAFKTENFVLSYVGNFKPNQNIEIIWQAIAEISQEIIDFKNYFQFCLTGNVDSKVYEDIKKYSIESMVQIQGFVSHKTATNIMVESNALLFVVPNAINNQLIITGKLFEYMASRTPIISIGPKDGDAAVILKEAGHNELLDYDELISFKKQLKEEYLRWINGDKIAVKRSAKDIEKFSRYKLTKILIQYLENMKYEQNKY